MIYNIYQLPGCDLDLSRCKHYCGTTDQTGEDLDHAGVKGQWRCTENTIRWRDREEISEKMKRGESNHLKCSSPNY
jgi:hypothetical protein